MRIFRISWFVSALLLACSLTGSFARIVVQPKITSVSIQGTNVVVKVSAPAGLQKVTVETRSRLEATAWAPKAVKRFESATTAEQELTFTFPRSDRLEVLRVRTDATDSLPAQFFKGTNQFAGPQSSSGVPPGGTAVFDGAGPNSPAPESQNRSVVESDIWKISGD